MNKYKIGDKILIKKHLSLDNNLYGECGIEEEMLIWEDKVLTIRNIDKDGDYLVEENMWTWHDDMIEGLAIDNERYLYELHDKISDYVEAYCDVIDDCKDCRYNHFKNCNVMMTLKYLNDEVFLK